MRRLILMTIWGWPFLICLAQVPVPDTNPLAPATKLEALGTNISTVIIKATTEIGSVPVGPTVVSLRCREITDVGSGRKEQGIAVGLSQNGQSKATLLLDYDEINSLQNGIDYLIKIDFSVTPLNVFDATFTTKGGFRIAALGRQRTGVIQFAIRDARTDLPPVILSRAELARFAALLDEAKKKLDSLRGG